MTVPTNRPHMFFRPQKHTVHDDPPTPIQLPPVTSDPATSALTYRLPRRPAPDDIPDDDADGATDAGRRETPTHHKLWSRHGYDYYDRRNTRLAITSARDPDKTPGQTLQEVNMAHHAASHQRFDRAIISPTLPPKRRFYAGNVPDVSMYKHMLTQSKNHSSLLGYHDNHRAIEERGPLNTPMPRDYMSPPPKSAHSIKWALSPFRNVHVDRKMKANKDTKLLKGRSKAQGPFSREFTVTCSTPNNWLRMKLGRSRSIVTS